jgi:tRNA pseudouridine38-40 synthase
MRNMVRIMAGTLIDVGLGKRRKEELSAILKAKSRRMASATAEAKGLRLVKVDY